MPFCDSKKNRRKSRLHQYGYDKSLKEKDIEIKRLQHSLSKQQNALFVSQRMIERVSQRAIAAEELVKERDTEIQRLSLRSPGAAMVDSDCDDMMLQVESVDENGKFESSSDSSSESETVRNVDLSTETLSGKLRNGKRVKRVGGGYRELSNTPKSMESTNTPSLVIMESEQSPKSSPHSEPMEEQAHSTETALNAMDQINQQKKTSNDLVKDKDAVIQRLNAHLLKKQKEQKKASDDLVKEKETEIQRLNDSSDQQTMAMEDAKGEMERVNDLKMEQIETEKDAEIRMFEELANQKNAEIQRLNDLLEDQRQEIKLRDSILDLNDENQSQYFAETLKEKDVEIKRLQHLLKEQENELRESAVQNKEIQKPKDLVDQQKLVSNDLVKEKDAVTQRLNAQKERDRLHDLLNKQKEQKKASDDLVKEKETEIQRLNDSLDQQKKAMENAKDLMMEQKDAEIRMFEELAKQKNAEIQRLNELLKDQRQEIKLHDLMEENQSQYFAESLKKKDVEIKRLEHLLKESTIQKEEIRRNEGIKRLQYLLEKNKEIVDQQKVAKRLEREEKENGMEKVNRDQKQQKLMDKNMEKTMSAKQGDFKNKRLLKPRRSVRRHHSAVEMQSNLMHLR